VTLTAKSMPLLGSLRRTLSKIESLARGISWADAVRITATKPNGCAETNLSVRMLNRQVTIRPGTSDLRCLDKVFIDQEYWVPFETTPRLIVDAGANIGLATLYFASKFPGAEIIAIEPEPSNYDLLVRNCSGLTNVTPWRAAVWNTNTPLKIANPDAEKFAFSVTPEPNATSAIEALTIPQILDKSGYSTIDILKLDIEGAERELFSNGCEEWLPRVRMIIMELHDRYTTACSRTVYSKLCQFPFRQEVRGENVFILFDSEQ